MTITTKEAERLAIVADELWWDLPSLMGLASIEGHEAGQRLANKMQVKTADIGPALHSLATERDALQARVAELEGALQRLLSLNDDCGPFGGEINLGRIDRAWDKARDALEGKKDE